MTISTTSGSIISGSKSIGSIVLGTGNYEYVRLQSDGNNFRIVSSTRNIRLANGFETPPWPSNWLFPTTSGYAAGLSDNGNVLSSYNSSAGLTVTLPSTNLLPSGWSMGFATDNNKSLTVQVNSTNGGHILWPGSGASQTLLSMASTNQGAYEFMVLQYDGNGSFRVLNVTPATAQAIGMIGSAGVSHWSSPSVSTYTATGADDGNVISSINSPSPYMAITLPTKPGLPMGWTMGITTDGSKTASVQVNASSGGHIFYPGSGSTVTSASLAGTNYELLVLQFDGSNFRVLQATPATATLLGILGVPGVSIDGTFHLSAPMLLRKVTMGTHYQATHADKFSYRNSTADYVDSCWLVNGLCNRQWQDHDRSSQQRVVRANTLSRRGDRYIWYIGLTRWHQLRILSTSIRRK